MIRSGGNIRWAICGSLMWAFFSGLLPAQSQSEAFSLTCLNLQRGTANTLLLLELGPTFGLVGASGFLETDMEVHILFRPQNSDQIVFEKRYHETRQFDFFSGEDPFFREYEFDLLPGSYTVEVDLRNLKTHSNHLVQRAYECRNFQTTSLSDILLLRETEGALDPKPLVGENVTGVTDRIRFQVEVYSPEPEIFTARAVLYRQAIPAPQSDDGDRFQVNRYTSIVQLNEIMAVENGQAIFSDGIDLFDLAAGRYLFEIFLYRDDVLIAEENAAFTLPWKRLREVFFDLDQSIDWMAHATTEEQMEALKGIEGTDEKMKAFREFWERRAEPGRETGTDVLERYYGRIFYANEFLSEGEEAGWKTDRGRIYTLYGAPDRTEVRAGHEVWWYTASRLTFVFEPIGTGWRQIHPAAVHN